MLCRTDISSILIIGAGPNCHRAGGGVRLLAEPDRDEAEAAVPVLAALLLLVAPMHAAACSPAAPADPRAARAAQLEEMTKRCGVPAKTLALLGPDEVTIAAGPGVEWGKVECLIYEIKKAKPKLQYMFMGNAPHETENQQ